MVFRVPGDVLDVAGVLRDRGYRVFVVGGAVRDFLMGVDPSDFDLVTNALPDIVLEIFSEKGWIVVPKGVEYGVVSVVHPVTGREVEIATMRREIYLRDFDRRSARVEYTDDIVEDLARRDFTINAIAYDPVTGEIIDPFNGRRDIEEGVIRFVGDPSGRIREDPLRMLRAIRFSSRFGFRIDTDSFNSIRDNWELIRYISWERIGEEIWKSVTKSKSFRLFVEKMYESMLYKHILPEIDEWLRIRHDHRGHHRGETLYEHVIESLGRLDEIIDIVSLSPEETGLLRLSVLLHDIGKPDTVREEDEKITFIGHEVTGSEKIPGIITHRWRLPMKYSETISEMIKRHHQFRPVHDPVKTAKRIISRTNEPVSKLLPLLIYSDTGDPVWIEIHRIIVEELDKPNPLLNGYDIMEMFPDRPPGPWIKEMKEKAYELQIMYNIEDKEELKQLLIKKLNRKEIEI